MQQQYVFLMKGRNDDMGKARNLCREEKRELKVLANDFQLLHLVEVQDLIETCKSYAEGHTRLMKIYEQKYMR